MNITSTDTTQKIWRERHYTLQTIESCNLIELIFPIVSKQSNIADGNVSCLGVAQYLKQMTARENVVSYCNCFVTAAETLIITKPCSEQPLSDTLLRSTDTWCCWSTPGPPPAPPTPPPMTQEPTYWP